MLLCALVGLVLAPTASVSIISALVALIGIALVAGSAAAINHLADASYDAQMARTRDRPVASGRISQTQGLLFSGILGSTGLVLLFYMVNPLTAWLNVLSWIGYGVVYTLWLKQATSQNIVWGGLFGATPPLFGWTAATNSISLEPLLLVALIFLWTPPHFWSLALAKQEEYSRANVPMLPVTHGVLHTKRQIVIYTLLTVLASSLPYVAGFSGLVYFIPTMFLGGLFVVFSLKLMFASNEEKASGLFRYSILYLTGLFVALLVDHTLQVSVFN